jgi:hypothetical protein
MLAMMIVQADVRQLGERTNGPSRISIITISKLCLIPQIRDACLTANAVTTTTTIIMHKTVLRHRQLQPQPLHSEI